MPRDPQNFSPRAEAARCRRLAAMNEGDPAAQLLNLLAEAYEKKARALITPLPAIADMHRAGDR